jgi:hypothetical protein
MAFLSYIFNPSTIYNDKQNDTNENDNSISKQPIMNALSCWLLQNLYSTANDQTENDELGQTAKAKTIFAHFLSSILTLPFSMARFFFRHPISTVNVDFQTALSSFESQYQSHLEDRSGQHQNPQNFKSFVVKGQKDIVLNLAGNININKELQIRLNRTLRSIRIHIQQVDSTGKIVEGSNSISKNISLVSNSNSFMTSCVWPFFPPQIKLNRFSLELLDDDGNILGEEIREERRQSLELSEQRKEMNVFLKMKIMLIDNSMNSWTGPSWDIRLKYFHS